MKLFIQKGYQLSFLPVPAKLVYSFFLLFVLLGIWTSWELYVERIGPDLTGPSPSVEARYLPQNGRDAFSQDTAAGGPVVDVAPAEVARTRGGGEDTQRDFVLDVFHQHLFSVSVVFLVLAHLFMLTPFSAGLRGTVVAVSGISSLLHVCAPVLIWKTGTGLALMPWTGALMGLTWLGMAFASLFAMWFGPAQRDRKDIEQ